jgi:hypothetical protein
MSAVRDVLTRGAVSQSLAQVLADADDADEVDYNLERARLESLFGGPA